METISMIFEWICRAIYDIVGGAISIAFVGGTISAFAYMIYFYIRYGHNKFVEVFLT